MFSGCNKSVSSDRELKAITPTKAGLLNEFSNLSMSYQVRDIFEFNCKFIFKAEALAWLQAHTLPIHPLLHARPALLSSMPSRYLPRHMWQLLSISSLSYQTPINTPMLLPPELGLSRHFYHITRIRPWCPIATH